MAIVIKCHGEFYAKEGQLKLTKLFDETVKAPSLKFFEQTFEKYTGTSDDGKLQFRSSTAINVRGQLKKKLLPMILSSKFPGVFIRVRGVVVDSILGEDGAVLDLPLNLMSIPQLAKRVQDHNIPVDPSSYINVDELRTDIMEYEQDPENFKRTYQRKRQKRAEEREFRELNNLMPKAEIVPPSPKPSTKKAGISGVGRAPTAPVNNPATTPEEPSPF